MAKEQNQVTVKQVLISLVDLTVSLNLFGFIEIKEMPAS